MTTPTVEEIVEEFRKMLLDQLNDTVDDLPFEDKIDWLHVTLHDYGQSRFEEGVKAERERVREWAKRKGERIAYRIDSYEHGVAITCKHLIAHLTAQNERNK